MATLTGHEILLVVLGGAAIILGVAPGGTFYPGLVGPRQGVKPVRRWFGRLWFLSVGLMVLYLGLRRLL
jgi:hypothetical protein